MDKKKKSEMWKLLSRVQLFATPWAMQSMEFSRPETGVGSRSLLQGNHPNPGIKPRSLTLQADSLPPEPPGKPTRRRVNSNVNYTFWVSM